MISRREFTGMVGAGILFPQNLVKAALEPVGSKIPDGFILTCLGTDEHPCAESDAYDYHRYAKSYAATWIPADIRIMMSKLPATKGHRHYYRHLGLNVCDLYLEIGNKKRPIEWEDLDKLRDRLVAGLKEGQTWFVTHLAVKHRYHNVRMWPSKEWDIGIDTSIPRSWIDVGTLLTHESNPGSIHRRGVFHDGRPWIDHPWKKRVSACH